VMALVRSVKDVAHRLRGTRHLRMLYLPGSRHQAASEHGRDELTLG